MSSPLRIWHPFTNSALDPAPIEIERAEGVWLYTKDGRRIIDAVSSWWVNLHGHANPGIAAAIAEQARKMEHVILAGFTHEPAEELATRLRKWLAPELTHLFFSDDGSTAVEVALKMAVQHFSNQQRGEKRESCHIECVQQLESLLAERGGKIAAVIVEPLLQGAGGMIVHPVEFLQKVRTLCTQHDVLLIGDEVLTGFGRTGKMFACDLAGVTPDLMCLSKGITGGFLPMGVTLCTNRVEAAFRSEDRKHTFYHGHSYTGNALACAAANASLQIFDDEPVFDRIATIARIHSERLPQLRELPAVGETRQI